MWPSPSPKKTTLKTGGVKKSHSRGFNAEKKKACHMSKVVHITHEAIHIAGIAAAVSRMWDIIVLKHFFVVIVDIVVVVITMLVFLFFNPFL